VAISSEDAGKVGEFVIANAITYPVGIAKKTQDYGSGGIPHAYLISPAGKVVWDGHPASLQNGQIEKLLRKTKDFYCRKVVAEVKPAAAAFSKGKLVEARKLATAIKDKEGAGREAVADAEYVLARVDAMRTAWKRKVENGTHAGLYPDVFDTLVKIQKHLPGTEEAQAAATKMAELKADPNVKLELKASKSLDKLVQQKAKAGANDKKLDALRKRVEKFIKKYEGTKAAERAELLRKAIIKTKRR
jgi:hypothetical protein